MGLGKRIRRWYQGDYIYWEDELGRSPGLVVLGGHWKRSRSARCAHGVVDFWHAEWKWIIGVLLTTAALVIAVIAL